MKCHDCSEEIDEAFVLKVGRKNLKLCEECADVRKEEMDMAEEAEGAMQNMMGYKGRR
jgi:uncharacterized Zn finger protein